MNLLADENVDSAIVQWLRAQGYDVLYVAEGYAARSDDEVLVLGLQQSRILLTSDLDFGRMVYRQNRVPSGVVLLRLRASSQEERLSLLQAHWPTIKTRLSGRFIVVSNRRIRIRPLPVSDSDGK